MFVKYLQWLPYYLFLTFAGTSSTQKNSYFSSDNLNIRNDISTVKDMMQQLSNETIKLPQQVHSLILININQ